MKRGGRLNPMSAKTKAKIPARRACCATLRERSGGKCEVRHETCTGHMDHTHEIKPRSAGGDPNNPPHGSVNLRELANTFRRMGDDANHVRLRHLNPRRGSIKADTKIRDQFAAAASAYYNCMRHVHVLLPNGRGSAIGAPGDSNEQLP